MPIPYNISDYDLNFFAKGRLITVPRDHLNFDTIRSRLLAGDATVDELVPLVDVRIAVQAASNGKLQIVGNTIAYAGNPLDGVWVDKIFAFMDKGDPFDPVFNALENLQQNPSFDARSRLPIFVERNRMGFLPDGRIVALKVVRDDYKDVHSGKFDNSVGKVVEMDRGLVDDNPNNTCSSGLHLGAMEYLPSFGLYNENRRVMLCAFWPADAVAVPTDYRGSKLRVCRYEVIDEMDKAFIEDFINGNTTVVQRPSAPPTPAYLTADYGDRVRIEGDDMLPDGAYEVVDIDEDSDWRLLVEDGGGRPIYVHNNHVKSIV